LNRACDDPCGDTSKGGLRAEQTVCLRSLPSWWVSAQMFTMAAFFLPIVSKP
jgi:hypothetical protein